jgi:hypothetical protein
VTTHQERQGLGPVQDPDAALPRPSELDVRGTDGARDDDGVDAVDVACVVAGDRIDADGAERVEHWAAVRIRTADRNPVGGEQHGDR